MARIKDTSVEAVKAAAGIVDVVSTRTQLRRSGARVVGRCPFHEERTPSFSVSPDKGTYFCFGCQKGGDAIRFVEETENLDFTGAIELLADRFRIPLEYDESTPAADASRRRRQRLLALLEQAAAFYERCLWDTAAGEAAREYLASRGLGEAVAKEFRLGLAPGGATLARKAREKGYTQAELAAAGLVNQRGNDYFSGRLLFPLADARGKVLGFQARKLREDDPLQAKYVNTREGELFKKGDLLYGLHLAAGAIRKGDRALVVEGNTDAIALRQAGVEAVVASMGTALTERQLKELGRLTRRLVLCFDGDAAGEAATIRGMELAAAQGLDVKVVALPPGVDPADSPAELEALVAAPESYLRYRVRLEIDRTLPDREEAFRRVREVLARFEDSPERQELVRYAVDRLGVAQGSEASFLAKAASRQARLSPQLLEASERLERDALAGVIANPSLVPLLTGLASEHFQSELHRRVRAAILEGGAADSELVPVLAELDARAAAKGLNAVATEQALLRLRERRVQRELAAASDPDRFRELHQLLARLRDALRELG